MKTTRINIEIPVATRKLLESLKERTGASSMTEVIRQAVSRFEVVVTAKENDSKIISIDKKSGSETELFIT